MSKLLRIAERIVKNHNKEWYVYGQLHELMQEVNLKHPDLNLVDIVDIHYENPYLGRILNILNEDTVVEDTSALEKKENIEVFSKASNNSVIFRDMCYILSRDNSDKAREFCDSYIDALCPDHIFMLFTNRMDNQDFQYGALLNPKIKDLLHKRHGNGAVDVAFYLAKHNDEELISYFCDTSNVETINAMDKIVEFIEDDKTFLKFYELIKPMQNPMGIAQKFNEFHEYKPADKQISAGVDILNVYQDMDIVYAVKIACDINKDCDFVALATDKKAVDLFNKVQQISIAEDNVLFAAKYDQEVFSQRIDRINEYLDLFTLVSTGAVVSKAVMLDDRIIEFVKRNYDKWNIGIACDKIEEIASKNLFFDDDVPIVKYTEVLDKYIDNVKVCRWLNNQNVLPDCILDELLKDRTYQELQNNPEILDENYVDNYLIIRSNICDELLDELSVNDIVLIKNAYSLVMDVHRDRMDEYKKTIKENYFSEMNRAINQADTVKGQIQMIREYCKEVEYQIKENAKDLMVVHDV